MPSPLHKYLFSPPPSPPRKLSGEGRRASRPLQDMSSALSTAELGLKGRSPRTPTQSTFTLDVTVFPGSKSAPTTPRRVSPSIILTREDDVEATPKIDSTPRRRTPGAHSSPGKTEAPNTPTISYSRKMPSSLPRPLLRLLVLSTLMMSCIFLMSSIPGAQLPSLHAAAISRRLALAPDGRAYYEAVHPVTSWEEARERDYVPPQIKAHHMMKRADGEALSARHPGPAAVYSKADRPTPAGRPLPPTHELLALQSYMLQSQNNVLPESTNPFRPLDANVVLGFEADEDALEELERERLDEVVVWYGGDGTTRLPKDHLAMLSALHGPGRRPTLLSVHGRSDLPLLLDILTRLDLPLQRGQPLVVIGNQPFVADIERMEEMRGSGQLEDMLEIIGWVDKSQPTVEPSANAAAAEWKPKLARWEKKEISEVEHALQAAKR